MDPHLGRVRRGRRHAHAQPPRHASVAPRQRDEAPLHADPEMLATLAHELRTPITSIFVGSRLLQSGRLRDDRRGEVVDALVAESERLRETVEDLIAIAGPGERQEDEVEAVLLQRLIPPILEEEAARRPGIRFRTHVPRGLAPVLADERVLGRLVKALVAQVVDLAAGRLLVEVIAHVQGDRVRLVVVSRQADIDYLDLASLFHPNAGRDRPGRVESGRTTGIKRHGEAWEPLRHAPPFALAAAQATARRAGGWTFARRLAQGIELGVVLPLMVHLPLVEDDEPLGGGEVRVGLDARSSPSGSSGPSGQSAPATLGRRARRRTPRPRSRPARAFAALRSSSLRPPALRRSCA